MNLEEFKQKYPALYKQIGKQATNQERERYLAVEKLKAPGMEKIIKEAQLEGKTVDEVQLTVFEQTKANLITQQHIGALSRDSAAAGVVRAGEAPISHVNGKKKPIDLLKNAFRKRKSNAEG
jgi:hypothetical protein